MRFWKCRIIKKPLVLTAFSWFSPFAKSIENIGKCRSKWHCRRGASPPHPREGGGWRCVGGSWNPIVIGGGAAERMQKRCQNPSKIHLKWSQNGCKIYGKSKRRPGGILGTSWEVAWLIHYLAFRVFFAKKWDFGCHFGAQWILEAVPKSSFLA